MTWSLPTPDDRVEWSLWTSANDTSSAGLKEDFKEAMTALGQHQYFTPYYQVGREEWREGGCNLGDYRLLVSFQCATVVSHPALPPSLPSFPSQVYDGASYNCVNFPDHCGSLCTNHGRYCMPDPDKDPYHGYSGRDIVIENLRYVPPSPPPSSASLASNQRFK